MKLLISYIKQIMGLMSEAEMGYYQIKNSSKEKVHMAYDFEYKGLSWDDYTSRVNDLSVNVSFPEDKLRIFNANHSELRRKHALLACPDANGFDEFHPGRVPVLSEPYNNNVTNRLVFSYRDEG